MVKIVGFLLVLGSFGAAAYIIVLLDRSGRKGGLWSFVGFAVGMLSFQMPLLAWGLLIDRNVWTRDRPIEWAISAALGVLVVVVVGLLVSRMPQRAAPQNGRDL